MLTLRRRVREGIRIGNDVTITVLSVSGGTVKLAIDAPGQHVLRLELVQSIEAENQRATGSHAEGGGHNGEQFVVHFPDGLLGLGAARDFVLYDLDEDHRVLVGLHDPTVALVLTDPARVDPNFPVDEACALFTKDAVDNLAVAVIVTPNLVQGAPTANLRAPLVIDTVSRRGSQVFMLSEQLQIRAPILSPVDLAEAAVP